MATQILPTGIKNFGSTTIDNIVLDTAGGVNIDDGHLVVTHGGNVTVDSALQVNSTLNATGNAELGGPLSVTGNVLIGGTLPSAPNISLNANGSASFTGRINSGDLDNTNGVRIYNTGAIALRQDTSGTVLRVVNGDPSNPANTTVVINQDGSAEFSGDVDFGPYSETNASSEGAVIRSSGYTVINRTSDIPALQIRQSGIANITLNAGGSVDFAGTVSIPKKYEDRETDALEISYNTSAANDPNNQRTAAIISTKGSLALDLSGATLDSNSNIFLNGSNGNGTFANTVAAASLKATSTTTAYFVCNGDGIYYYASPENNTGFILANGSAKFAAGACEVLGNGTISNTVNDASAQASVISHRGSISGTVQGTMVYKTAGNLELRAGTSDVKINLFGTTGSATFTGNITAPNVTFNLELDNDANYITTTDSEGVETRVYNGPTLDVKDRLTKTQDALTALKTAAQDNATDLAGLKAAIVAALANI